MPPLAARLQLFLLSLASHRQAADRSSSETRVPAKSAWHFAFSIKRHRVATSPSHTEIQEQHVHAFAQQLERDVSNHLFHTSSASTDDQTPLGGARGAEAASLSSCNRNKAATKDSTASTSSHLPWRRLRFVRLAALLCRGDRNLTLGTRDLRATGPTLKCVVARCLRTVLAEGG